MRATKIPNVPSRTPEADRTRPTKTRRTNSGGSNEDPSNTRWADGGSVRELEVRALANKPQRAAPYEGLSSRRGKNQAS